MSITFVLKMDQGDFKMLKKPESMDECVYFTRRTIESGRLTAWAFRKQCSKCNAGLMGKPIKKNGKPDKKSPIYTCYSCGHQESNESIESSLVLSIEYTCPFCNQSGETTTEYVRKMYQGIPSFVFTCQNCGKNIGITKKMKE